MCFDNFSLEDAKTRPKNNTRKWTQKYRKNRNLTLRNLSFTRANPWDLAKPFCSQKKSIVLVLFADEGGPPETLYFTQQKGCTCGAHVGSILDRPDPKNPVIYMVCEDFTRFVFELQK